MLKLKDLSLRRGVRELLIDVSLIIHAGQKVGVTGANGVGKSSVFAMVMDQIHADAGDFSLPPNTVIAHVAQETPAVDRSAIDYVMDGDTQLRELESSIAAADGEHDGEALAHYYAQMEAINGYTAKSRASRLLHGLGFEDEKMQQPVTSFSGGWRMRLNLGQALMCRSDLLLLDEPTNHLDLDTVIWLEDWLRAYTGTLLLISHDRDFLDRVVTHIGHLEHQQIALYKGNYSDFEIRRAEQLSVQQAAYEKQQREIKHMQSFVDRFKAKATKARQAQSRVKALERMKVISQAHVDSPFDFHFREPESTPSQLVSIEKASIGYGDVSILKKVSLKVDAGARIGLLGHNGAGKSTLIKLLSGELALQSGKEKQSKDLRIGYFAQHQLEQLDSEASPLLHLQRLDPKATEQELRNYLGGFAFHGDMAKAIVKPFSGGEKARLVLALLVYQKPNLLLLDEPTNHLDLEMRHALCIALQEFVGAMIIVSHDRHLLRTVADTLLLVADGAVTPFDGDLDDYRQWVKDHDAGQAVDEVETNELGIETPITKKQQRQDAAEKRKLMQPLTNKVKKLEKKMHQLEKQKAELHDELANSDIYEAVNKDKLKSLLDQQTKVTQELEEVEEAWFAATEELEAL